MKRYLRMVLAGLLVLGLASPLYAAPDIKVNGQIRTRLRYWVNISLDENVATSATTEDRRYFDNRTRLGVDAKLSEGVRAVIQLEKYFDFGNVQPNGTSNAGLATIGATPQEPYIRQAWLDFQVPGLPEGWRLQGGRSFFRLGNGFLWGNSLTGEDGFTLYGPLGPGKLKARFAMPDNQSIETSRSRFGDNEDMYFALDYKFPVAEKQNLEVYWIGNLDKGADNYSSLVSQPDGTPVRHGENYWFGAFYNGVAGPVALKAEAAGQFGKTQRDVCFSGSGAATPTTNVDGKFGPARTGAECDPARRDKEIDRSAFFLYGQADYKITPAWSVGLALTYASGDDDPADDDAKNFVGPLAEFTTSPTRVWTDSQFFYGNRSGRRVGNNGTNRAYNFWGQGTEDTFAAASFGNSCTGSSTSTCSAFSPGMRRLAFNTKYTFSKQVTGLFNIIPVWADKNPGGVSKYVGTEIDGKIAYKMYKNLVMNGYFGYFFANDGFFKQKGSLLSQVSSSGVSTVDDAWLFRWELIATF